MIFKFALSESDGVDFVEDESGNGRLCLHARDRDVTSNVTHDTAMYTVKGGRVIANQLQFVPAQEKEETSLRTACTLQQVPSVYIEVPPF
jgi:hypothetical protein